MKEGIHLFRGISIEASQFEEFKEQVENKGIIPYEKQRQYLEAPVMAVRRQCSSLFDKSNLQLSDIRQSGCIPFVFATGEIETAVFYAERACTQEKKLPIVLEFEAGIENVYVDCKDWLVTVFSNPSQNKEYKELLSALKSCYGTAIEKYFRKAYASQDRDYRIALANLATFDEKIVTEHLKNIAGISGRYGVTFCTSYVVQLPSPITKSVKVRIAPKPLAKVPIYRLPEYCS